MEQAPEYIVGNESIVNTSELYSNTWNPKDSIYESEENKRKYEEIKKELETKGQLEAVTVRELNNGQGGKYQILDGFHRWLGTSELKREKIKINNLGVIADELAMAITVIKEEKKVPVSQIKLADVVVELVQITDSKLTVAELLGYTDVKVDELLELAHFDWDDYNKSEDEDFDDKNNDNETFVMSSLTCPKCEEVHRIRVGSKGNVEVVEK